MVYRIGEGFAPSLTDVQAALEPVQFVECGASQEKSIGWVSPRGEAHGPLVESVAGQWIMKLMIESKAVPGNVVRRKADERIAEIEAATGRKPGKKEKRDLMDDVLLSLLPQAFARQSTVLVWMDLENRRLVLNAGSQGKADEVMSALMNVMGGLSVSLIQTVTSPQAAMTQWLLAPTPDEWPSDLTVEREVHWRRRGQRALYPPPPGQRRRAQACDGRQAAHATRAELGRPRRLCADRHPAAEKSAVPRRRDGRVGHRQE